MTEETKSNPKKNSGTKNSSPKKELTYSNAVAELEAIVKELDSDNCDIDMLTVKVKRATELLAFCREKLTATESSLSEALEALAAAGE